MTRRFLSLSPKARAAFLNAKQSRFLERLARELDPLGPAPNGDTPHCFRQRIGRPSIPVRTALKDGLGE